MSLRKVAIEIVHGGMQSLMQYEFVYARNDDEAKEKVIEFNQFRHKKLFRPVKFDDAGKPYAWVDIPGEFSSFEIAEVQEPFMRILGIGREVNLGELMGRPVLPFRSGEADWVWTNGIRFEYWWREGDIVVTCATNPGGKDHIHIDKFSYFALEEEKSKMEELDFTAERSPEKGENVN